MTSEEADLEQRSQAPTGDWRELRSEAASGPAGSPADGPGAVADPTGADADGPGAAGTTARAGSGPSPQRPSDLAAGAELPPHDHAGRRERVREIVRAEGATLLLVTDPVNVRYLSGFSGTNGQVLIGPDAEVDRLVTDGRYEARAATEAPDLTTSLTREPVEVALELAAALDGDAGVVAAEADHLTWSAGRQLMEQAEAAGVEVLASTQLVERCRLVKDDSELARLALACDITQRALAWLFDEVVAVGRTERELATALERRFVDLGADGVAFPSIVASGPNSAIPHHAAGARPVELGDLLTVDCGALVDGYHADHTRTIGIGHLDDELVAVHALVERAQAAGREAAVAGASTGDVDAAAREIIDAAGYRERFVHGTGHGVGLRIHEAPAVAEGSAARLEAGIALTVEPGVYLPGLGGVRIEDTLVVTADGPARALTDTPRELIIR
jgi:Xaa-Pro aminopeptidase